ncbi:MAG: helix-turn-helix domain-containing protein [Rhodospirillaceae bacterium]|nr:helix-turn-helix domain-containing protein [Rhodospirillaceae bacterium]
MKEPLRVPFEATEPDLAGPRLVHETGREDPNALPTFCEELREARNRGGYSIADAAHVLRIQEHYLEALEAGRFDQIPGTTYAIGFLRSYSGFLGLDPDEIVDAFKREQGLDKSEQRLAFPSPTDTSPKPKFWLILLVLVLAGLAYGGWQYQSTGGQIATDLVDDVSTRLSEAVGMGETVAPEEATATSETAAVTAAAPTDAAPATETTAETAVETAAAPAAAVVEDEVAPTPPEPAPAAERQEEPALAEPAPAEPAATEVAEAGVIPAAEVWDEAGPAGATEVAALEGSQVEVSAVQPPPATVEAVPEPAAPAAPGEPAVATAGTPDASSTITAPLDFAVVATGGTSGANSGDEEAVASESPATSESTTATDAVRTDVVSVTPAAPAAPEPAIEAAPEQTAEDPAPAVAEPELTVETAYVPKVYGRTNLDARVVITAVDDSWVQVQGPDNELLLTRILHPGDTYRVPDRPGIVMVTGNAGGLEIQVDNAPAPALGPLGVVIRNIALDPDRLLAGTAIGG